MPSIADPEAATVSQPASAGRRPTGHARRAIPRALSGLLLLATIGALYLAQDFLVPVMFAVTLAFLLRPIVRLLQRLHLPLVVASAIVVVGVLGLTITATVSVYEPAKAWVQRAPETLRRVEHKLQALRKPVEDVGRAAAEVEKIATTTIDQPKVTEVQIKGEAWPAAFLRHVGAALGSLAITVFLLFFLLATDGRFLRRLFELILPARAGTSLLDETEGQISRYLVTVTAINLGAGMAVAGAMALLGMPNPILWGVLEATLNFVPYFGAVIVAGVTTVVAIVTFDDLRWIMVPLAYVAITNLEGMLITPLVLGRRFELDPVVVFLWLIFWGSIWSVGGALLAMPMLVMLKVLGDRTEVLAPFARLINPAEPVRRRIHHQPQGVPRAVSTA